VVAITSRQIINHESYSTSKGNFPLLHLDVWYVSTNFNSFHMIFFHTIRLIKNLWFICLLSQDPFVLHAFSHDHSTLRYTDDTSANTATFLGWWRFSSNGNICSFGDKSKLLEELAPASALIFQTICPSSCKFNGSNWKHLIMTLRRMATWMLIICHAL